MDPVGRILKKGKQYKFTGKGPKLARDFIRPETLKKWADEEDDK